MSAKQGRDRMARTAHDRQEPEAERPELEQLPPAPGPQPVQQLAGAMRVPTQRCPHCGRGMQPRVDRNRMKQGKPISDLRCALCGRQFIYYHAMVEKVSRTT